MRRVSNKSTPTAALGRPAGEQHWIKALRGQRLNVMAALFSDGSVIHSCYWSSSTAEIFLDFVGELGKSVTKPLVIVIGNASIHCSRAIQPALKLLEKKGITLKFLPPYSPKINRIETLWRLMKQIWSKRWTM